MSLYRLIMTNSKIYLQSKPPLQSFVLLSVGLAAMKAFSFYDPYLLDSDDLFAEISQWVIILNLIFATILQDEAASPSTTMGIFLILLQVLPLLILGCMCLVTVNVEVKFFADMAPGTTRLVMRLYQRMRQSMKRAKTWVVRNTKEEANRAAPTEVMDEAINEEQKGGYEMTEQEQRSAYETTEVGSDAPQADAPQDASSLISQQAEKEICKSKLMNREQVEFYL